MANPENRQRSPTPSLGPNDSRSSVVDRRPVRGLDESQTRELLEAIGKLKDFAPGPSENLPQLAHRYEALWKTYLEALDSIPEDINLENAEYWTISEEAALDHLMHSLPEEMVSRVCRRERGPMSLWPILHTMRNLESRDWECTVSGRHRNRREPGPPAANRERHERPRNRGQHGRAEIDVRTVDRRARQGRGLGYAENIQCHNCHEYGHRDRRCPEFNPRHDGEDRPCEAEKNRRIQMRFMDGVTHMQLALHRLSTPAPINPTLTATAMEIRTGEALKTNSAAPWRSTMAPHGPTHHG